jgi:tRNA threonylcarbamoyl adenosine modification protein (Sua5/YciO/YrdC/YwlC family)
VANYTKPLPTQVFKIIKRALPGPYTFLLAASNEVPKILNISKKTVGIRIPENNISQALVAELGNPIISASIKDEDQIIQYTTDAETIFERYKQTVDVVINGGPSGVEPSTVVDLTSGAIEIIREGLGDLSLLY